MYTIIFKTELIMLEKVPSSALISTISKYKDFGFDVKNIEIIEEE